MVGHARQPPQGVHRLGRELRAAPAAAMCSIRQRVSKPRASAIPTAAADSDRLRLLIRGGHVMGPRDALPRHDRFSQPDVEMMQPRCIRPQDGVSHFADEKRMISDFDHLLHLAFERPQRVGKAWCIHRLCLLLL